MIKKIIRSLNKHKIKIATMGIIGSLTLTLVVGYAADSEYPLRGLQKKIYQFKSVDYDYIHEMTNTIVLASEKWGMVDISHSTIKKVQESDLYAEDKLIQKHIDQWAEGNFSGASRLHNYCWDKLDGTVGRADGVDWEKVEILKEQLGY